jgi:uncharacterized metal-binding protein
VPKSGFVSKNNFKYEEYFWNFAESGDNMAERVCLFPCGGIKKTESTVARIATYIVNEELLPRQTIILCVPAFLRGVEEDLVMVEDYPTLVIDCHAENCGTNLLFRAGILPAARVFIPDIAGATGLGYGSSRRELEAEALSLAEAVAGKVAAVCRSLLEPDYVFPKQKIKMSTSLAHQDMPADPFAYLNVSEGIYRPASMPDFSLKGVS